MEALCLEKTVASYWRSEATMPHIGCTAGPCRPRRRQNRWEMLRPQNDLREIPRLKKQKQKKKQDSLTGIKTRVKWT